MTDIEQYADRKRLVPCSKCGAERSARNIARHESTCVGPRPVSTEDRFWAQVTKDDMSGCWVWGGALNFGYGRLRVDGSHMRAHRYSWLIHHGDLPDNEVLDHICRNRACVNPDHLRLVSIGTNSTENSESFAAVNKAKTECMNGHPFTDENTYVTAKGRHCKECRREAVRRYREGKRGQ